VNTGGEYQVTIIATLIATFFFRKCRDFLFITILVLFIFIVMATKYGLDFPFRQSKIGDYVKMTISTDEEIRANLIHLLLTRKGSRYFLPDFGSRLYEYIFDLNDSVTYAHIEDEIRDSVRKYIPNLEINSIKITNAELDPEQQSSVSEESDARLFRVSDASTKPYTAKIRIDYTTNNGAFGSSDFIIINI
jgi:phage baseplate assembly protein W